MILTAKSASLLAGVFQPAVLFLVIRYSKTRIYDHNNGNNNADERENGDSHLPIYLTSVVVWSAECLKLLLSLTLEIITRKKIKKTKNDSTATTNANNRASSSSSKRRLEHESLNPNRLVKTLFSPDSFKLIIPAFLYVVQNNLLFFALSNLSVPTFQVTNQGKLITTAIISRILLKKRISTMQYLSLVLLAGGVAFVILGEGYSSSSSSSQQHEHQQNEILGLLAVTVSCFTSGFAGVYFELVLKTTTQISVHTRNCQLAFWSILLSAGRIVYNDMPKVTEMGLFQGFDGVVIIVIVSQALTGLVVSLMIKYADAILKGFATSIAVVVGTVASIFIFHTKVDGYFFLGAAMVGTAVRVYSRYDQTNTKSDADVLVLSLPVFSSICVPRTKAKRALIALGLASIFMNSVAPLISSSGKDRDFYVGPVLPSAATAKSLLKGERRNTSEAGGIAPHTNYPPLIVSFTKDRDFYVGPVLPSAATVKSLLEDERQKIIEGGGVAPYTDYELLANTYALTYAFVREFERRNIPIFLSYGSHIGAVRHHGIIPFSEKDVDFAVFSEDDESVSAAIKAALTSQGEDAPALKKKNFGYQYDARPRKNGDALERNETNISHYFDFWFFQSYVDDSGKKQVKCVGWNKNGCKNWYQQNLAHPVPIHEHSDWFPPRYQVFGTHRVPVSSTNKPIEMFEYDVGKDIWNTTCGPSYHSPQERVCSNFYDKNPFVFLKGDGTEQLRQGSIVLHEAPRAHHKE